MDLRDYFKVLRRRWPSIVLIAIILGGLAGGLSALETPMYASNARLFVSTSGSTDASLLQGGQFSEQRVKSYADLISSRELAERVISDLDLTMTPTELSGRVSAQVSLETVNMTLTAIDTDPRRAQQIVQVYAEQLVDMVRELETPQGGATAPIKATIVDAASLPSSPVSPQPERNVALGIAVGLALGIGLSLLRHTLDTRVTSVSDVAEISDRPVLGAIAYDAAAKDTPLVSSLAPHSPRAEAFRVLRTNLQFVDVDSVHKVFVVTSAIPEEGKTATAVNVAISLAHAGVRTLLIEGDLRRPRAAQRLGLDGAIGLTSALVGRVAWQDAILSHDGTGLDFLGAGPVPPNPAELLQSKAMQDTLADLREKYDVVIIDAPPLLPVTDAALLAARADGALLVIRHGKVTRDQIKLSVERLNQVDARLMGVVMNMTPTKGRGYGYGYGYGDEDARGKHRTGTGADESR